MSSVLERFAKAIEVAAEKAVEREYLADQSNEAIARRRIAIENRIICDIVSASPAVEKRIESWMISD